MLPDDEIIVLDNVVSPRYQDMIESWLLDPVSKWSFQKDIALADNVIEKLNLQTKHGFSKGFFNVKVGGQDELWPMILPLVFEAFHKANLEFNEVLFSRSFLTTPIPGCGLNDYDHIHVDAPDEHMVCLYYANDADGGDTVYFDRTVKDVLARIEELQGERPLLEGQDLLEYLDSQIDKKEWNVIQRVSPKKGRCVIFNGARYHSAARCQSGHRLIVNTCVK
jgi:hypothetical protein